MKIQLIANGSTKWEHAIKRWGLAFLVGDDLLFDTFGDPKVFLQNVKNQEIDLSKIKHIVLSHDDWDHIAGLWEVINTYKNLKVYVGPHFQTELKNKIRASGVQLIETPEPIMIREGVYTTGELAGDSVRGVLYEQGLVIKDKTQVTIMTGCAHPKLLHILCTVKEHFNRDVHSIIGGFHLKEMTHDQIKEVIEELLKLGIRQVVPLHCTGSLAVQEIRRLYGNQYVHLHEGEAIEV